MNSFEFKPPGHKIVNNGDSAYSIIFEETASQQLTKQILSIRSLLEKQLESIIIETIPSYQSLTLLFNPIKSPRKKLLDKIKLLLSSSISYANIESKLIEIPVCYEVPFAPDMQRLSDHCQLTCQEIIERHTKPVYWVAMLGFLPGFVYLSGLDKALHCPRKSNPSLLVSPGSIAIGNQQTGIYSLSSPGGWNVIGRTPTKLLTLEAEQPIALNPLDEIKFTAISERAFLQLQNSSEVSTR